MSSKSSDNFTKMQETDQDPEFVGYEILPLNGSTLLINIKLNLSTNLYELNNTNIKDNLLIKKHSKRLKQYHSSTASNQGNEYCIVYNDFAIRYDKDHNILSKVPIQGSCVRDIIYSSDDNNILLLECSSSERVMRYNCKKKRLYEQYKNHTDNASITSLAPGNDSNFLISYDSGTIESHNILSGQLNSTYSTENSECIEYSFDSGRNLIIIKEDAIELISKRDNKLVKKLAFPNKAIRAAYSQKSQEIAIQHRNKELIKYDSNTLGKKESLGNLKELSNFLSYINEGKDLLALGIHSSLTLFPKTISRNKDIGFDL